jgi:hypothetical protein
MAWETLTDPALLYLVRVPDGMKDKKAAAKPDTRVYLKSSL